MSPMSIKVRTSIVRWTSGRTWSLRHFRPDTLFCIPIQMSFSYKIHYRKWRFTFLLIRKIIDLTSLPGDCGSTALDKNIHSQVSLLDNTSPYQKWNILKKPIFGCCTRWTKCRVLYQMLLRITQIRGGPKLCLRCASVLTTLYYYQAVLLDLQS